MLRTDPYAVGTCIGMWTSAIKPLLLFPFLNSFSSFIFKNTQPIDGKTLPGVTGLTLSTVGFLSKKRAAMKAHKSIKKVQKATEEDTQHLAVSVDLEEGNEKLPLVGIFMHGGEY